LLQRITEAFKPHLQQKGATLATHLAPGLRVRVDGPALESAVLNLLENAVKYARDEDPDRSIEVELARAGDQASIEVRDHGRGVPDEERERIFDSFYRASNSGEVRGAGLGLSLVRHFAQAHGGTVTAHPRAGGGTIFRILLPMLPSEPAAEPARSRRSKS
jgi:signal transduction histidine kinase